MLWIILIQAVISGILSSVIAEKKGQASGAWFSVGFFFGIFGLIAAAGLPMVQKHTIKKHFTKKCPNCAELIKVEAIVCKYCNTNFDKEQIIESLLFELQKETHDNLDLIYDSLESIHDNRFVPPLINIITKEQSYEINDKAMVLLSKYEDSIILDEYFKIEGKEHKFIKVLNSLDALSDKRVIPYLLENIKENRGVNESIKILSKHDCSEIIEDIIRIIDNTKRTIIADELIDHVIRKYDDPSILPYLMKWLLDVDKNYYAEQIILKYGKLAIPYLEEIINKNNRRDKKIAKELIKQIL